MEAPYCKKCSGNLKHKTESDFWICERCGSIHVYIEEKNNEQIALENLRSRLEFCAEQINRDFQHFMESIIELRQQSEKYNFKSHIDYEIEDTANHSYQLFCTSDKMVKVLINTLVFAVTPCSGGHFELLSDIASKFR